jgi:hypothetical protein
MVLTGTAHAQQATVLRCTGDVTLGNASGAMGTLQQKTWYYRVGPNMFAYMSPDVPTWNPNFCELPRYYCVIEMREYSMSAFPPSGYIVRKSIIINRKNGFVTDYTERSDKMTTAMSGYCEVSTDPIAGPNKF